MGFVVAGEPALSFWWEGCGSSESELLSCLRYPCVS